MHDVEEGVVGHADAASRLAPIMAQTNQLADIFDKVEDARGDLTQQVQNAIRRRQTLEGPPHRARQARETGIVR